MKPLKIVSDPSTFRHCKNNDIRGETMFIKKLSLTLTACFLVGTASSQDICKSVPIIFKQETVYSGNQLKTSFKQMLCSAEWKTYSDVVNAGVDVTIPIFDIPIPISANYSSDKREAWQKKFCTASERKLDYQSQAYRAAYEVSAATADAWVKCLELQAPSTRAISCKVTETESSAIFEARWLRVDDELDSAAPKVVSLAVKNTTCPSPTLKPGVVLQAGGTGVLCGGNVEKAPTFLLQTTRGSCVAAGQLAETASELAGQIVLSSSTTFRGNRLLLKGGTRIVTDGYNLTFNVKRLDVEGGVEVISFLPRDIPVNAVGRTAGEVRLQADKITGSTLMVKNFGEDGGAGSKGRTGDQGPTGRAGDGRSLNFPGGCSSGDDGRPGGQGQQGGQGQTGANGGNGGDVILSIKSGLKDGIITRVAVIDKRLDRAGSEYACNGVCGGLGGIGGGGGDGGSGGKGGEGAPGTPVCGGTNAGPPGPAGAAGLGGGEGARGGSGLISGLN